ncbi:unnamed protein product [Polarella glacialis]|uniref:Uncharacterized protein n=1 Tax=Polarella glacialis TaxID=89957 RepID=A0A813HVA1_POLGL|nr:unnamed protein product [Polarella glacialis]
MASLEGGSTASAEWLDTWLEALGDARQAMLDGREQVDGEQRQLGQRRWRDTQRTLTPISGQYRPMWREAMLRRVAALAEGTASSTLAGGSSAPFELPDEGRDSGRGSGSGSFSKIRARNWRCGAVISWATLPMDCEAVASEISDVISSSHAKTPPSLLPAADGSSCHCILNRALLRSPSDAAALGFDDCGSWFGLPSVRHNASYAVRPQWLHADPVAVAVLERVVLPEVLQQFVQAAEAVKVAAGDAATDDQKLLDLLTTAVRRIAEFTFYMFNGAPYTRGSAAIGVLAHHALYLWLIGPPADVGVQAAERGTLARHRLQAMRCLPHWQRHSMPDIEASSAHTAQDYWAHGAYWSSFQDDALGDPTPRGPASKLPALAARTLSCLRSALWRPGRRENAEEMEQLGRLDSRRLQQVLRALGKSSATDASADSHSQDPELLVSQVEDEDS